MICAVTPAIWKHPFMTDSNRVIQPDDQHRDQLLDALQRVLDSGTFGEVSRLKKFLDYVVRETIAGNGDRLKGFVIANEVFEKQDPYDAQTTTVVRVEAGRLRRRLKDYYDTEGTGDSIRISMPKGGYAVLFNRNDEIRVEKSTNTVELPSKKAGQSIFRWVVLVAVAAFAFFYLKPWESQTPVSDDLVNDGRPTVAIMPFRNLTDSAEGDSVAQSMTEDLVISLANHRAIDIISVTFAGDISQRETSLVQIGRKVKAGYVLQSNLRQLEPEVQVTAHLVATDSGREVWAEKLTGETENFWSIQQQLAQQIPTSLSIDTGESNKNHVDDWFTDNKEAWQLYKQAMDLVNPPSDPKRLMLAQQVFDQVAAMDPDFAGGYAGQAYIKSFTIFFGHSNDPLRDHEIAMEFISKARSLDASFGLTHSALAFLHLSQGEQDSALEASERAVDIHPNDAYVNAYHGFIMASAGDINGGIPFVERALRLDPMNPRTPYMNILGVLHYLAGDFTAARDYMLRSRERGGPDGPGQMRFLAASYSKLGDSIRAEAILREADALEPDDTEWKNWLLRSFADREIPERVISEIEYIKTQL